MRVILILFSILGLNTISYSQELEKTKETDDKSKSLLTPSKKSEEKNSNQKSLTEGKTEETLLTPEEQGFTKYVVNGEIIYRKHVNGILVEYKPK